MLAIVGCSSVLSFRESMKDSFPDDAVIVEHPDCWLPDIRAQLEELTEWNTGSPPPTVPRGYPPSAFGTVAVVRCERGQDVSGSLTIDTVRLGGDIAAVVDAFRTPSRRFTDENTTVSCAIREWSPAGLWFVDATGRAIRPQWPLHPCGFLPDPSAPLAALNEIARTKEPVEGVSADNPGRCQPSYGPPFTVTSQEDVDGAAAREDQRPEFVPGQSALATPIANVGRLQVCRIESSPEGFVEESRTRLTLTDSRQLMRAVAESSIAPPCNEVASRIAEVELRRPDGSGGTPLSAELDGCRRVAFGGYRAIPVEMTNLLISAE